MSDGKHADLTEKIIGAFYRVYNTLGYGFNEKVYENALAHELRKVGLTVDQQKEIQVYDDGQIVGNYTVDLLINGLVTLNSRRPANYARTTRRSS